MTTQPDATQWQALIQDQREAVNAFIAAVTALPANYWEQPAANQAWSPASLTEHLTRVYTELLRELQGGPGMALKFAGWQRWLIRWLYLPRILKGHLPRGVRAPKEVRPSQVDLPAAEALQQLREQSEVFMQSLTQAQGQVRLTHPYMGQLDAAQVLRYCTVHIRDHQQELPQPR